jgi:hypothetical protein
LEVASDRFGNHFTNYGTFRQFLLAKVNAMLLTCKGEDGGRDYPKRPGRSSFEAAGSNAKTPCRGVNATKYGKPKSCGLREPKPLDEQQIAESRCSIRFLLVSRIKS